MKRLFSPVPWEKLILWGLFLLSLWIFRSFLVVIFVTFILSYITYYIIKYILRYAPSYLKNRKWFRPASVVGIFTILLLLLYTSSLLIFPAMLRQGDELITTITQVNPKQKINEIAVNFFGEKWLYNYKDQTAEYNNRLQAYARSTGTLQEDENIPTSTQEAFDDMLVKEKGEAQWQEITSSPHYKKAIENVQKLSSAHLGDLTFIIAASIKNTAYFFIQFFISLIFSFIIVLDIPRLYAQFQSLRNTRLRQFYDAITPGLHTFSDALGTAFAAQAVIAVCNTVLTYLGMIFLDIPLAELMSLFVFFCSFIPVLGVFISSVPISLVALQTDGFSLMLESIMMITIIHILEAYLLNPKITGNFFKIHPLLVLAILFVGSHFFGIWGLLLGVPVCVYVFRHGILGLPFPKILK